MTTEKLTGLLLVSALASVMLVMGLRVAPREVIVAARRFRQIGLGLAANFILVPLVTVALLYAFGSDAMVSVGFLVLAVCPGAPLGPPFTAIARGDVPYALGLMVVLAALSAILSPALLSGLLAVLAPGRELHIDYVAITRTLLAVQVLPLVVGLAVHQGAPRMAALIQKPLGMLANLLLILAIGLILVAQHETLSAVRLRGWCGMLLLLSASLAAGWFCGGPGRATRKALAVSTAVRNAAVGLVIVAANFVGTSAVTAVVAYAFVSMAGGLASAWAFRKLDAGGAANVPVDSSPEDAANRKGD